MRTARSRSTAIGVMLLAASLGRAGLGSAQEATVRGTVRSEDGIPIAGVRVTIPELAVHTTTDSTGQYAFSVPAASPRGRTVRVAYAMEGFVARAESLANRPGVHVLDVTLPPVVATDLLRQLAGRVPGLSVFSASGRPGAQPDVLVRGPTSLNAQGRSQAPLYVVDGVVILSGLPAIDPQDVATIEVVPGAAGASLQGLRGGRGVVSISTRSARAAADGLAFGFRSEAGASDVEHAIELARQHALLTDASGRRFCISDAAQPLCARTLDWTAETERVNEAPGDYALSPRALTFDPGSGTSGGALRQRFLASVWPVRTFEPVRQVLVSRPYRSVHVDAVSGSPGARYVASASYLREPGAIRYLDGLSRYTARLNVDRSLGGGVQVALRSFLSRGTSDGSSQEDDGNLFFRLTRQPASADLLQRDALGRLYARSNIMNQGDQNQNPLLYTTGNGVVDRTTDDRFIGGGTLRWAVAPWADLEAAFSYDRWASRYKRYVPKGFRTQSQAWTDYRGSLEYDTGGHDAYDGSLGLTLRHTPARGLDVQWVFRSLIERLDTRADRISGDSLAVPGSDDASNIAGNKSVTSEVSSERLVGLLAGVSLRFRETIFGDLVLRRDGSSLLGVADRWATFGRASLAYRISREGWWPFAPAANEFTLRSSYGTAGSPPSFRARYETFSVATGGAPYPGQLANPDLRPETSAEFSVGADLELFRRVGVSVTYAHTVTRDQILPVAVPSGTGFPIQWQNAGTLDDKTWELSVNVPVLRSGDLSWSFRVNYDRTRTTVTRLDVAPYSVGAPAQGAGVMFQVAEGERYGTIYGYYVLRGYGDCDRLPADFRPRCGPDRDFQVNSDGYLSWIGAGNSPTEGLSKNLWMTGLTSAQAPWGVALNWGMLIALRDSSGARLSVPLGSALPDYRVSVSQNFRYRRLTVYGLLEAVMGRSVWNRGRHWSYIDFINRDLEQRGVDPGLAKPIGYYHRSSPPDHGSGINGLYQTLAPYNAMVEDASFAKLREVSVTYRIGRLFGGGDWAISLIGRNVLTITSYRGWDPEVGYGGGVTASSTVNAVDAYTFPNVRTFSLALSTRY